MPPGLDRLEIIARLGDLYASISESLAEGDFRPYVQGRYRNRVAESLDCREWCRAFSRTFLLFADDIRADESLGSLLVPFMLLAEPEGPGSLLSELDEAERPAALELARSRFISAIASLHDYIEDSQPDEEED